MDRWIVGKAGLKITYINKLKNGPYLSSDLHHFAYIKNGPYLSCDLHHLGANEYSKLPVAPFSCKKSMALEGRKGGWMGGWNSQVKDCLQQSKMKLI